MTLAITWAKKNKACEEAIQWIESQGPITMDEAWNLCSNSSWLLRALVYVTYAQPTNVDRVYRLLACDFAERALLRERTANREPNPRSWNAIAVSRAFANGLATVVELKAAEDAAFCTGDVVREAVSAAAGTTAARASWAVMATAAWATAASATGAGAAARKAERAWQCDAIRTAFASIKWVWE